MKKSLSQKIDVPSGIEVEIIGSKIKIKGKEGEITKELNLGKVNIEKKNNQIILSNDNSTKKEKKIMNTSTAHIKNMLKGVQKKYEYKLKICSSHFPMTVKIEGNKVIIKNFLGEKKNREVLLPKGVEVKLDKEFITIISQNKELAGQAAANFETITKIRNRDKRIFQDGIYITDKSGREI